MRSEDFFLDYDGMDDASRRFGRRARDLAGASGVAAVPTWTWSVVSGSAWSGTSSSIGVSAPVLPRDDGAVLAAAGRLANVFAGRLDAYAAELDALSGHVCGSVRVTNEVDVDLSGAL